MAILKEAEDARKQSEEESESPPEEVKPVATSPVKEGKEKDKKGGNKAAEK
jgi:hypothetical protein